ncbi:Colicin V production protein [Burkholderiales bacterium]|nr:Colicin V production protein [Burkholderiales bacterium]
MTALDAAALAVVALSIVFAYARGIIRSLVGTAAWIVGFVAAFALTPALGAALPAMPDAPFAPYVIAFIAIFVAALVVGALVAWPLRAVVRKSGMGFLDASLGATFGLARGIALMVAFALVAGVSGIAQRDWWQNAFLAPSLASSAMALRPWLPHAWAERLDFSPAGPMRDAIRPPGKA